MKSHIKDTMYEIFPKERDDVDIISNTEIGNIKLFGVENKDRIKVGLSEKQIVNKNGIFALYLI